MARTDQRKRKKKNRARMRAAQARVNAATVPNGDGGQDAEDIDGMKVAVQHQVPTNGSQRRRRRDHEAAGNDRPSERKVRFAERQAEDVGDGEMESTNPLPFEDACEDEYDSEDQIDEHEAQQLLAEESKRISSPGKTDPGSVTHKVYRHGVDMLNEGEELVHDETAYEMLHMITAEWPSLSFDIHQSLASSLDPESAPLGAPLSASAPLSYPLSICLVAGTQADRTENNKLTVMKLSRLFRTRKKPRSLNPNESSDDEDEATDDEDDEDSEMDDTDGMTGTGKQATQLKRDCVLRHSSVRHSGTVNRVRLMPQQPAIVASWSEDGQVYATDLLPCYRALSRGQAGHLRMAHASEKAPNAVRPFFTLQTHSTEGYALDWSPLDAGLIASGDCAGGIYCWRVSNDGSAVPPTAGDRFGALDGESVEDIQWSPTEQTVFASCGTDRCIRFWDTRQKARGSAALTLPRAHESDVNVISWNRVDTHLLVSGGDDGALSVWDLRSAKSAGSNAHAAAEPAAHFAYHAEPITAVAWHPTESSMLAASSEDHSVSVWDLAVERDAEEELRLAGGAGGQLMLGAQDVPPQLLFVHLGQKHVKDIRWHPHYTSVLTSSAADGFNVFRVADIF